MTRLASSRVTSTSYGESKEVWLRWFLKYRDGGYNQPYDSDPVSMIVLWDSGVSGVLGGLKIRRSSFNSRLSHPSASFV